MKAYTIFLIKSKKDNDVVAPLNKVVIKRVRKNTIDELSAREGLQHLGTGLAKSRKDAEIIAIKILQKENK